MATGDELNAARDACLALKHFEALGVPFAVAVTADWV